MATFTTLADVGKLPDLGPGEEPRGPLAQRSKKKKTSIGGRSGASHASCAQSEAQSARGSTMSSNARRQASAAAVEAKKKKMQTLTFQARSTPGKLRLRELDPRRIVSAEVGRVVLDWRKNRWEGTYRLIDRLLPTTRMVQYTMKLTGAARSSIVPEFEDCPSSDEDEPEESAEDDDDAVVNSDEEGSSAQEGSSTATGSHLTPSAMDGASCSGMSKMEAKKPQAAP